MLQDSDAMHQFGDIKLGDEHIMNEMTIHLRHGRIRQRSKV